MLLISSTIFAEFLSRMPVTAPSSTHSFAICYKVKINVTKSKGSFWLIRRHKFIWITTYHDISFVELITKWVIAKHFILTRIIRFTNNRSCIYEQQIMYLQATDYVFNSRKLQMKTWKFCTQIFDKFRSNLNPWRRKMKKCY